MFYVRKPKLRKVKVTSQDRLAGNSSRTHLELMCSETPAPDGAPPCPGVGRVGGETHFGRRLWTLEVLASVVMQVRKWVTDMGGRGVSQFDASSGEDTRSCPHRGCLECAHPPSCPGESRSLLRREGEGGNVRMFTLLSF